MTAVAVGEAALIALLIVVIYGLERMRTAERRERAQAYESTLQTMANRIQRPELVPVVEREPFVIPEPELDEFDLVGAIQDPPKED